MREIRRKDRILSQERANELLEKESYGFLAMVNADGGGYGIPISFVADKDKIYFHCAPVGHKLDNIEKDPRVTFSVVGNTEIIPNMFTTAYESVMVYGKINRNLSEEERLYALRLIVAKYSKGHEEIAEKYIKASFKRTEVLRLDIEGMSAKGKKKVDAKLHL